MLQVSKEVQKVKSLDPDKKKSESVRLVYADLRTVSPEANARRSLGRVIRDFLYSTSASLS
jgi:hypothetical protein